MLLLLVPAAPASGAAPLEWGIDVKPLQSNMQSIESAVGRSAASTRIFLKWDSAFPDSYHTWLRNSGHKVMISVKPQYLNGTVIKWADVAAAQPGSRLYAELVAWADRIKAFGGSTTFTFHHEPEATANIPFGTATTYKAAWQRVVTLFRSRAVGARFYWIVTANSFRMPSTERRHADKW